MRVLNLCLELMSINSVLVIFRVSLFALNQLRIQLKIVYTITCICKVGVVGITKCGLKLTKCMSSLWKSCSFFFYFTPVQVI